MDSPAHDDDPGLGSTNTQEGLHVGDDSKRPHSSVQSATTAAPRLNPRSCVTCRRRKVRCNKQEPCANCVRAGIECIFPAPGRAPRKSRKPPDAELLARLKRLEGVVHSLGAQVDDHGVVSSPTTLVAGSADIRARSFAAGDAHSGDSPSSDRSDSKRQSIDKSLGRLVINEDRSRYVSNSFWTSMSDEIAEMQDLLDPSTTDDEDENNSPVQDRQMGNHQGFLFGYSSIMLDLREMHPSPSQIFILWEVFKENVDPVVRMLHRPTTKTILMNAASSLDRVSRPAEALLFSIYYGAVVSMTHEQCRQLLDEDKEMLLKRYRFATEQALARADFLNSSSLMCLQAFAFFLVFVRHVDDSRLVWALGGLAIHLAQSLGIHRDGNNFGLSPFDTEMRRRLWWHLSLMDNRAAEDHGTDPTFTEQFFDTKLPMNYNDDDIYPGMKEYPPERQTATEMTFCLIRSELSILPRRLNFTAPGTAPGQTQDLTVEQKEKLIDECHRHLEEKYLRHCDPNVPIFWVAATVARLILAKIWLSINHPRSFGSAAGDAVLPQEVRDRVFITSVEVLEFTHLLEKNEKTAKWGWFFRTYMQWQSVAFALSEICIRPPGPDVDRAWRAVEAVYDDRVTKNSKFQRGMLWKPLRHLMARAQELRKAQKAAQTSQTDTFFTDIDSSTTLQKFAQNYPDNMVSNTADVFGMTLDQPSSTDVPVQSMTSGSPRFSAAMYAKTAGTLSQDGSSDTTMTPGQFSLSNNEILNFGWSPSLGDFAVRQEPFERFFMNIQEEWF